MFKARRLYEKEGEVVVLYAILAKMLEERWKCSMKYGGSLCGGTKTSMSGELAVFHAIRAYPLWEDYTLELYV